MQIINTILSAKESNNVNEWNETGNIFSELTRSYGVLTQILNKYYALFLTDFARGGFESPSLGRYDIVDPIVAVYSIDHGFVENKFNYVNVFRKKISWLNEFDDFFAQGLNAMYSLNSKEKKYSDVCSAETVFLAENNSARRYDFDSKVILIPGWNSYSMHIGTIPIGILSMSDDTSFFINDGKFSSEGGLNIGMILFNDESLSKIDFT